jgi:hypothetical protein
MQGGVFGAVASSEALLNAVAAFIGPQRLGNMHVVAS